MQVRSPSAASSALCSQVSRPGIGDKVQKVLSCGSSRFRNSATWMISMPSCLPQLGSGDSLALPKEVVDYLDRLRATGAPEAIIEPERDAWILMAARWPEAIPALLADKVAQLANPKLVRLYPLIGRIAENGDDEELLRQIADLMSQLAEHAAATGELDWQDEHMPDAAFIRLMDSFADASHPAVPRLRKLFAERGWTGWTRIEKREP